MPICPKNLTGTHPHPGRVHGARGSADERMPPASTLKNAGLILQIDGLMTDIVEPLPMAARFGFNAGRARPPRRVRRAR